jgi:ADP-ribose pyrophosphatase YjhB (NUDIX family)
MGETLIAAVQRELSEETGLSAQVGGVVGVAEVIQPELHAVIVDYEVTIVGSTTPQPGDDAADARWVPLDEVPSYDLTPGTLDWLIDHQVL